MPRKVRSPTDSVCINISLPNSANDNPRSRKRSLRSYTSAAGRPARRIFRADNSSNSGAAHLSQLLPDVDDLQEYEELSSPPAQAFQQQGRMQLSTFVCLLENRAHQRCIAVSSSPQGAQCIAIASPKPGSQDTLLGQAMEHVLSIPMAFADEPGAPPVGHTVYLCTCEEMQSTVEEAAGLGLEARGTFEEFQQHVKLCIHAEAVSFFSSEEQLHEQTDLYLHASDVVLDDNPVVLVHSGSLRAKDLLLSVSSNAAGWPRSLVGSTKDQVFCCLDSSCCAKGRRFKCEHCSTASQWLKDVQEQAMQRGSDNMESVTLSDLAADLEGMHLFSEHVLADANQQQPDIDQPINNALPVSQIKIAPDLSHSIIQQRLAGTLGGLLPRCQHCHNENPHGICCHCVPPMPVDVDHNCHCGCAWHAGDPVAENWKIRQGQLFGFGSVQQVQVFYRPCSNSSCKGRLLYQGNEDCVFNYSNHHLVTYELGFDHADSMCEGKVSFSLHFRCLVNRCRHANVPLDQMMSRGTYRKVLQAFMQALDMDYDDLFTCKLCQEQGATIIMDGKEMGINKALSRPYARPMAADTASVPVTSPHNSVVSVPEAAVRNTLHQLASGHCSAEAYATMLESCQRTSMHLDALVEDIVIREEESVTCPREYRAFLKALAKNYPAAAILNPSYAASDFVAVLQPGFVIGYAAARAMHENFPELHSLKQICLWESIPRSWLPFLEQLAERAAHIQNAPELPDQPLPTGFEDAHCFMPAYPLHRALPKFRADKEKSHTPTGNVCAKYHRSHPGLTPGAFTVFCAHAICLGFKLMTDKEGCSIPFELMYTRFRQAPKMVVYDNACNLQRYALKRAPHFFRNTRFCIDKLHVFSHRGQYPGDMSVAANTTIKGLNTQVAEQVNSLLEDIRSQVAYMMHDNAMIYIKYFLGRYNMRKKQEVEARI